MSQHWRLVASLLFCLGVLYGCGGTGKELRSPRGHAELATEFAALAEDAIPNHDAPPPVFTFFFDPAQPESARLFTWLQQLRARELRAAQVVWIPIAEPGRSDSIEAALAALHVQATARRPEFEAYVASVLNEAGAQAGAAPGGMTREQAASVRERLRANLELAQRLGVLAAPALYFEGRGLPYVADQQALLAEVQAVTSALDTQEKLTYHQKVARHFSPDLALTQLREAPWAGEAMATSGQTKATGGPIPVAKSDPTWGDVDAPVTIVEASDFECPFCDRVQPTLEALRTKYGPRQLRFVFKHNPLPFHRNAFPAHVAAAVVHDLGGDFWKFRDLAFEHQRELTPANFAEWAEQAGVSRAAFDSAFEDPKYVRIVREHLAFNSKLGVVGTPAFRINGLTLSGAQPLSQFVTLIDAELAAAAALAAQGTPKAAISIARTEANWQTVEEEPEKAPLEPDVDVTVWNVPVLPTDPVRGKKDALVTIVTWSDFQCPYCQRVESTLDRVLEEYGDDVRVVWKDNPLPFHPHAKPAALLARYAYQKKGNDAFWKLHQILFENQQALEEEQLLDYGTQLGFSKWAIKQALSDKKSEALIAASQELAMDLEARGTPHFFINGRRLSGAQPFEKFKEFVDEQLVIARAAVASGVARAAVYDQLMKDAKKPAEPETREVPAFRKASPSWGSLEAPVTIQVFSDFECPFCARVVDTLEQIKKEHGQQVRLVWRNLPLPFHKDAALAAEAAQEAFVQRGSAGFWKYHDLLFENQQALSRDHLEEYAEQLGLDMERFRTALAERTHQAHVQADIAAAQKAGIKGTPGFMINEYFLSGAQPYAQFRKLVQLALKKR